MAIEMLYQSQRQIDGTFVQERTFKYGIITLRLNGREYPVHRDLLSDSFNFFKELTGDANVVTLDPALVTEAALDYFLCMHYPNAPEKELDLSEISQAVVAWEFLGGATVIAGKLQEKLYAGLSGVFWYPAQFHLHCKPFLHEKLVDVMERWDIFEPSLKKYNTLDAAVTPEHQAQLVAIRDLQDEEKRGRVVPRLEDMTIKDLLMEYNVKAARVSRLTKGELMKLVKEQRASSALTRLLAACDTTDEVRAALFEDMLASHDQSLTMKEHYVMFVDGSIYRTKHGRTHFMDLEAVVHGPFHVAQYFFHGVDEGRELPGYSNLFGGSRCIVGQKEVLHALHQRFRNIYPDI